MERAPAPHPDHSISQLLLEVSQGNRDAEAALMTQVYGELRRLARKYMRAERANHTLQATALVNEAYLRLMGRQGSGATWQDRAHFYAAAAQLMRHILVDHARAHRAGKRGGEQHQVTLSEGLASGEDKTVEVLALHEALEKLASLDPRQARVVELHFFGGLTFPEIACVLDTSERTVKRDWTMARAWLKIQLTKKS
jgi:RNA polymerase sigma-70 factor, ECF subfamily